MIRGSVQVMKTEAVDEPSSVEKEDEDNNTFLRFLSGAVFDLYEDTNGNKEFDSEDKKTGTLKESDAGYHTAEDLLAKGYFVKESKAPEGYQLDESAYYFEITQDGQVAVVENGEAGRGFTNEAYRGNLKITKDSSDGARTASLSRSRAQMAPTVRPSPPRNPVLSRSRGCGPAYTR